MNRDAEGVRNSHRDSAFLCCLKSTAYGCAGVPNLELIVAECEHSTHCLCTSRGQEA